MLRQCTWHLLGAEVLPSVLSDYERRYAAGIQAWALLFTGSLSPSH